MPSLRGLHVRLGRPMIVATALAMVGGLGALTAPGPTAEAAGVDALGSYGLSVDRSEDVRSDASRVLSGLALVTTAGRARSPSPGGQAGLWEWPMGGPGRVARNFDGPAQPWLPGHRGVDLAGFDGVPVMAVAGGVVTYAGAINGVGIISVQHVDGLLSTYQPVTDSLPRGRLVRAGQRLGFLETTGSHCWPRACLHLGARHGQAYLDPLLLLGVWEVSLLPTAIP